MRVLLSTAFRGKAALIFLVAGGLALVHGLARAEEAAPRCEARIHDSGIEPFGRIVSVRPGQEISLPDFRLQAVNGTSAAQTLQLKRADGIERTLVVPQRQTGVQPFEFELDGRRYVVEVNRSLLERRALAGDEFVVWPRDEYQAALGARDAR